MEQRRKRALDEKSNHNKNRQKREQYERESRELERELTRYQLDEDYEGDEYR